MLLLPTFSDIPGILLVMAALTTITTFFPMPHQTQTQTQQEQSQ